MIRIYQMDFKKLKGSQEYGGLCEYLVSASRDGSGAVVFSPDGTMLIREQRLREAFRKMLAVWIKTVSVEFLPNEELALLQKEQREAAAEKAKLILEAANKRVIHYQHEEGLLEGDHNLALLKNWFDRNNAPYTAANLDLAVSQLSESLHWAVWAPRLQKASEARLIEGTNEPELPIDATESQMRRATKVQLQDLSKRRGEFQQSRRDSFGSKFIEPTF